MGKNNSAALDRDRAFDINNINELLAQGKAILNEAIRISGKMEGAISSIAGIYGGIEAEYKEAALGGDISSLSGKLEKEIYQDTIDWMDRILNKLINDIPTYDSSLAQSMDAIQEVLSSVKSRVGELKGLLEAGDVNLAYPEFKQRLEELKARWDETTEDLSAVLSEIENDMLGVSAAAAEYSRDPVNLSTGNFVYDHEDLKIGGEIPLSFHRYYNAKDRAKGSLGRCFKHNYEISLKEDGEKGKVTVCMEDGQKKTFQKTEEGTYKSLYSATETLVKEEGSHVLKELSGRKYVFDGEGRMTRQENRMGRGITFSHDEAGRLKKAETDNGAGLTYDYNEEGQLVCVTDHIGRRVELNYERRKLVKVKTPKGSVYEYRYGKNGRIEETVNARGNTAVKNAYDEKHRIIRQDFPDGGCMEYAYDDNKRHVILTERNGSLTTYVHDSRYRNTDILYEDGTKEHFEYNGKNQRVLYVDRNGNATRMAYDNRGNLTQIINALGQKLSITYDACNNPTNIKINEKEKQKNRYDARGNILEMQDALLQRTIFAYDKEGRPETITQPDGSMIRLSYDGRGNITGMTNAAGGRTGYAYDALNRVVKVTDPKGNAMSLTYDEAGNIRTLTNGAGDTRTYEYNESNKVTAVTDFDGGTIKRSYNVLNKPERITDQQGRETVLTYDAMWNLSEVTMPDGGKTGYRYDGNNRLSSITDAMGNTVSMEYDGNGKCIKRTDQAGNATRFTYDAIGRMTHAEGPDGWEMSYAYDEEGHVTQAEDAMGNKVTMEYDEAGQLIREINPLGESRSYTYSPLGKVKSITDEAGLTTAYEYLPGGQLKEVCYPDGTKESYTYDLNGNIETRTDKNGFVLTYDYDSLDRITSVTGSGGEKKEYTYDAIGNVTSIKDANGNTTRYEYSLTGKLTKVTDALGNETVYTYDPCDRLMEIRQYGDLPEAQRQNEDNRICHVTRYERNLSGQVTAVTDPLGQTERYTYDVKGQLLEKLDKEGYLTKYGYTAHGDVSHIQYEDGREVKLSYNPLRQLQEMEDWLGITRIENDPMGRAAKVQYPDGKEISYTYGKLGERTSIIYPDGKEALYTYGDDMKLISLQDKEGTITYAYDELGRLSKKTFPGGMETLYAYDEKGFLSGLTHMDKEGILDRYAYEYDLMGNKTLIEKERRGLAEESGTYTYRYDPLGRLSEVAKDGELLRTYGYDAFGNRTNMKAGGIETTYTYNAMNQLICKADAMNEETYAYDNRGNLSLIMENGTMKNRYTYGALNRLEEAVNRNGERASYEYNGLGHRVGKMTGRGTPDPERQIRYTIDLTRNYHNLLQKEEGGTIQTYLWDGTVAGMMEEDGRKERREEKGLYDRTVQYYFQDELGSPIRLMDRDGSLRESYGYDEFGQDLYENQGKHQPFGYTGYQMDQITGTYYAQAREYRPDQGRFAAVDLIKGTTAVPYTLNEYGYCWGNPEKYVDRDGKLALPTWEDIKNGWDSLRDGIVDIWEKQIYGVNTIIYEADLDSTSYNVYPHEGGNIIVAEQKGIEVSPGNSAPQFTDFSINISIDIPKTNITMEESLSVEFANDSSWKLAHVLRRVDKNDNLYVESGYSIDSDGINIRTGAGGTTTDPIITPDGTVIDANSELSWSLTTDLKITTWKSALACARNVVGVVGSIAVLAMVVADDAVGGQADNIAIPGLITSLANNSKEIYGMIVSIIEVLKAASQCAPMK